MREGDREEDRGRRHREEGEGGKERKGNWGGRGRGGITARLRFKAPWLENCVRQDCESSHSE